MPYGITKSLPESERKALINKCLEIEKQLETVGIRVKGDYCDEESSEWKFKHWELKVGRINLREDHRFVASTIFTSNNTIREAITLIKVYLHTVVGCLHAVGLRSNLLYSKQALIQARGQTRVRVKTDCPLCMKIDNKFREFRVIVT